MMVDLMVVLKAEKSVDEWVDWRVCFEAGSMVVMMEEQRAVEMVVQKVHERAVRKAGAKVDPMAAK